MLLYSASAEDRLTVDCFLVFQETNESLSITQSRERFASVEARCPVRIIISPKTKFVINNEEYSSAWFPFKVLKNMYRSIPVGLPWLIYMLAQFLFKKVMSGVVMLRYKILPTRL